MHVVPLQQPFGHRPASHAAWHDWFSQCCVVLLHVAQLTPPVPHAASAEPDTQVVPMQQPDGHKPESHAGTHA
jgi:hypothetical protein